MIELDRVEKRYADRIAVEAASFVVHEGETLVLLGRSGSGKTTTLKMLNRLIEPTAGTIRVFGKSIREQPAFELRRRMGYVIQDVGLFPHYSIRKNVAVVPELLGWDGSRIRERVDHLLEQVGLPAERYGELRPRQLSGGEQQRVGLARALVFDPPIVLLDEPFGALDPITRREMQREFLKLSIDLKKTMVLVTHDVAEAIVFGTRICLFEGGRVEQIGTAKELLFEPRTDFVRAFFDPGRLELELNAVSLGDVLPYLDLRLEAPAGKSTVEHTLEARLLDVLSRPRAPKNDWCRVQDARGQTRGFAPASAILEAFYALPRSERRS